MSTALRIAAVTQVLKDLLNDGLINNDASGITQNNVTVTSLPPDKIPVDSGTEVSQLNIYMYQTSFNQGWRNAALPFFNAKGERVANPPLAIDLHYLLTAYGSAELHTDILLGLGMHFLHETPTLDKEAIKKAIGNVQVSDNPSPNLPDALKFLSQSGLDEQLDQIKITPEQLPLEEISKLWAAFGAKYRPCAAYKVTVVLIESNKSVKTGLPVKARNIYVQPFKMPVVDKVLSQSSAGQPIIEGQKILNLYRLFLQGNALKNEIINIRIDGKEIAGGPANIISEATEVSFNLPDQLSAGMHEVQVVHPRLMGTPEVVHEGISSQSKLFVISPDITQPPTSSGVETLSNGTLAGTIELKINPAVQPGQRVLLLLNEITNDVAARAYSFAMDKAQFGDPQSAITDIEIEFSGVKQAAYLVRLQVDGAESPLGSDAQGKYISPSITL
ncbi:MAG TPA: DUF4255 domain-containing protein [Flavipsychrobacter sp.]|nr:DUF4255 domain-containing protein [Flavipsychrobacter sp.]